MTKRYAVAVEGKNRTFCIHRHVVTWRRFFGMFAVKTRVPGPCERKWKIEREGWVETGEKKRWEVTPVKRGYNFRGTLWYAGDTFRLSQHVFCRNPPASAFGFISSCILLSSCLNKTRSHLDVFHLAGNSFGRSLLDNLSFHQTDVNVTAISSWKSFCYSTCLFIRPFVSTHRATYL